MIFGNHCTQNVRVPHYKILQCFFLSTTHLQSLVDAFYSYCLTTHWSAMLHCHWKQWSGLGSREKQDDLMLITTKSFTLQAQSIEFHQTLYGWKAVEVKSASHGCSTKSSLAIFSHSSCKLSQKFSFSLEVIDSLSTFQFPGIPGKVTILSLNIIKIKMHVKIGYEKFLVARWHHFMALKPLKINLWIKWPSFFELWNMTIWFVVIII